MRKTLVSLWKYRRRCIPALLLGGPSLLGCSDGIGEPIRTGPGSLDGTGSATGGGYCATIDDWSQGDAADENSLFAGLAALRLVGTNSNCSGPALSAPLPALTTPLPPVTSTSELRCSARRHSRDMTERAYFAKVTPEGEGPEIRMQLAGYASGAAAEIIVHDQPDPNLVLEALLRNGGADCESLFDPRLVAVGVGKSGNFWTVDLAGARNL